jgi:hypothetical protein
VQGLETHKQQHAVDQESKLFALLTTHIENLKAARLTLKELKADDTDYNSDGSEALQAKEAIDMWKNRRDSVKQRLEAMDDAPSIAAPSIETAQTASKAVIELDDDDDDDDSDESDDSLGKAAFPKEKENKENDAAGDSSSPIKKRARLGSGGNGKLNYYVHVNTTNLQLVLAD